MLVFSHHRGQDRKFNQKYSEGWDASPYKLLLLFFFFFFLITLFSVLLISLPPFLRSSDGPVVGQCYRDVGWPNGQHHSAWEEEAVVAGSAFPPAFWQQVRIIFEFFLCWFCFKLMKSGLNCIADFRAQQGESNDVLGKLFSRLLFIITDIGGEIILYIFLLTAIKCRTAQQLNGRLL